MLIYYCINRKCKIKRRENMETIFKILNCKIIFSKKMADKDIDIKHLSENDLNEIRSNKKMTLGEIACSISHFNLWTFKGDKRLIGEDDLRIDQEYPSLMSTYIKELDQDTNWDIVLLSRNCFGTDVNKCFIEREKISSGCNKYFMVPEKLGYGAHTYIVNKRALQKIADKIYPLTNTIDVLFNEWHNSKTLVFYVALKNISMPIDLNDSDTV